MVSRCNPAAKLLHRHNEELVLKSMVDNFGVDRGPVHPVIQGENVLLQLAANSKFPEKLTIGVLYCLPLIYANVMVVRSVNRFLD